MQDEYHAAIKITPAAAGTIYSQLTLNDWVAILTIAYVVLQIGLLIPKYKAQFPDALQKLRTKIAETKAALVVRLKSIWQQILALLARWRDQLVAKIRGHFTKTDVQ